MDETLLIRYVVVDDIDFTPMWGQSTVIEGKPTEYVRNLVKKIQKDQSPLQKYALSSFKVLKILKPVPRETALPADASEIREWHEKGEPLSLVPILQLLRERTRKAKKIELANDYVRVLRDDAKLQNDFKHEDGKLISAIVVRCTTPGEKAERDLQRPGMIFRRKNLLDIIDRTNLREYALMDRPADRYAFPVALFDKNLALLQLRLESLSAPFGSDKAQQLFPNEVGFYNAADKFISVAIRDYPSHKARLDASEPFLEKVFVESLELEYDFARIGRSEKQNVEGDAPSAQFDGAYVTTIKTDRDRPQITRVIVGVQNRVHEGDALSHMTKGYAEEVYGFKDKDYFESTYFPKVFVVLNGNRLEISVAVCLETVVVNEILSLNIRDNFFRSELKQKLARVFEALKECSNELDQYYSNLTAGETPLSFFPSPTLEPLDISQPSMRGAFDASSTFRGVKILGRLGLCNEVMTPKYPLEPADVRYNLFLATWLDSNDAPAQLIVKIVKRYGEAAHECLARKDLAPKLFLCQPVIGNLTVVVMECVKGYPLHVVRLSQSFTENAQLLVFKALKRAISALEKDGLVHGDLRAPNVLVDESNPAAVKIIDFDWAAKHDEGFYPSTINMDALREEWHNDVGPMKKMKMEHDKFAVFNVLGPGSLSDVDITEEPCDEDICLAPGGLD